MKIHMGKLVPIFTVKNGFPGHFSNSESEQMLPMSLAPQTGNCRGQEQALQPAIQFLATDGVL